MQDILKQYYAYESQAYTRILSMSDQITWRYKQSSFHFKCNFHHFCSLNTIALFTIEAKDKQI